MVCQPVHSDWFLVRQPDVILPVRLLMPFGKYGNNQLNNVADLSWINENAVAGNWEYRRWQVRLHCDYKFP
jgi:hypothetical protein